MKKIKVKFERFLILCIQTIVRFIYYHPFVICLVFFLLKLYKSFPSLLAFLVSSSPVIVCTFLLLGLLLSYGVPNIPVIKEENKRTWDASSMDIGSSSRHLYAKENENISIENHVDYGNYNDEKAIADEEDYHAVDESEGNKNINTIMIKISSGEEVKKTGVVENEVNQLIQGKEHQVQGSYKDDIVLAKKLGGGAGANVIPFSIMNEEAENFMLEIGGPALYRHFDSSLGVPCQSVEDHHVSSDTESDGAESSSPDASMTNIIPLLEELHPLLNSEHVSITKLDAASEGSLVDHESDDNGIDEKDFQEKDEAQEEKVGYDVTAAVRWTEDDQKNVMDLGSSELERNQRLANLIAKRRARKYLTFRMDRNPIDWDANDSFPGKYELSRLHVQVPLRRNPFDIPNDSEETMDLPPIPGSAPSSLLPRRNPFDFLYDDEEQDDNLTGETWDLQDIVPASRPESLFRRVDTFDLGRRDLQQERHQSRFKPYFTPEMDLEGTSIFQTQYSDNSESKASFVSGSDTVSPATDQEHKRELERQEVNREVELSSLAEHGTDAGDRQIHTFKEESDDADKGKREHTNYIEIDEASPSASWSSLDKQSTIDEALQRAGQGGNLDSLMKFDMIKNSIKKISPGALEVTAASGTADFLPVNAIVEELSSVGKKPFEWFPTSVFIDENRSRLSELDDDSEYNAAKIGKSVIQEVSDQDGSLISLEFIESSEYLLDSSIVMEKISEISIQSISDLSKSSSAIESPVLTIHEADALKTVNSSDEESSSALDTGKTLPAEIDGSANSHIRELPSNHEGSDLMFQKDSQSEDIASGSKSSLNHVLDSKGRSAMIAGALGNQFSEESSIKSQEVHSEVSQDQIVETQTWSPRDPRDNIEQTFLQSNEACPSLPIYNEGESRDSPDNVDMDAKLIQADSHVVESNSIEAIDVAFGWLSHSISNKAPKFTQETPSVTIYYDDESRDSHDDMHTDAIMQS